jgi:NADPH:quinone reductase-like Zn-dependent oxidoreductase
MGKKGIIVGFTSVGHLMSVMKGKAFGKFPLSVFVAKANTLDLETLAALIRNKKISVHIERTFPSKEIPEAIRFIEAMRTRGKVAMVWE